MYHIVLPNYIDEQSFGISFRTIASDSSGIQHIIEHGSLCGSDKFPVKEPFSNLLQSSL